MTDDLMFQDEIHQMVREAYGGIPSGAGRAMATRLYSDEELDQVPEAAVDWSLGVGNPVRHAGLREGDVVVDLGCGGGIDTVIAAHHVGQTGRVIAVDTLDEMCDRTRRVAAAAGVADRCEVLRGEMEALPIPDEHVDMVISNGVINLSPRKSRALAECTRVLRPGGRFCVADLLVDEDLPPEVMTSGAAWAGCVAGALSEEVFTRKLDGAGLVDVRVSERIPFSLEDVVVYPLFTDEVIDLMRRLLPPSQQQQIATSVIVHAHRPVGDPQAAATS